MPLNLELVWEKSNGELQWHYATNIYINLHTITILQFITRRNK